MKKLLIITAGLFLFSAECFAASYFIKAPGMSLSPFGGEANAVTVASKSISAGTWYVSAKANPVNRLIQGTVATGSQDIARCALYVNSTRVDWSSSHLGDGPTVGSELLAVATITNQTRISVPAGTVRKVSFKCWHDYGVVGQYLDASASLYIGTAQ